VVGVSSVATRNRVRPKSGMPTFVNCGADIMLTGLLQDVEGKSRCPACDRAIRLDVEDGTIKKLEPSGALLHYVSCGAGNDSSEFGVICDSTFLFDREECLDAWKAGYMGPAGRVVTPMEFLEEASAARRC